jgi:ABC-type amino acid transport substrate-binding protein
MRNRIAGTIAVDPHRRCPPVHRLLVLGRLLALLGCALPAALAAPPAQAGVRQQVLAARELRVCVVPDYAGISLRDPRTGTLYGLDIDLSRQMAARLGVKVHYVESDFIAFPAQLSGRQCDIAMMGIWVTTGRAARVVFTQPYLSSGAYAVAARANSRIRRWEDVDHPGTLLAVLDTPDLLGKAKAIAPRATVLKVPVPKRTGNGSTVNEVMTGRADAYLVDYSMAQQLKRDDNWGRVITPPRFIPLTEIAWAVAPGDPDWLATANHFLTEVRRDGTLAAAAARHGLTPVLVRD